MLGAMSHLDPSWKDRVVWPDKVLERIEPGMRICLSTGAAEPRTLIKHLMASEASNLQDLELLQIVSLGDALSPAALQSHKYRLKTFYSGWAANEAITAGWADLIPTRFARIPELLTRGRVPIDVAMVQVSVPNESGFCSLGTCSVVASPLCHWTFTRVSFRGTSTGCRETASITSRSMALRSATSVVGARQTAGKSRASARIRARSSSVSSTRRSRRASS